MKQKFVTSDFRQNCQSSFLCSLISKKAPKFSASNQYFVFFFSNKKRKLQKRVVFSQSMDQNQAGIEHSIFFNFSFDKGRLKSIVSWFLEKYGQYKTLQLLEKLKEFGFGYATLGGISLGIDDLKVPNQKVFLLHEAETKVSKDLLDYRNAKISGIERMQRLIYTWNQTNETLKQEVVKYFETTDLFNPIYMMAFSGARGNMSQVRQLVGMRGLMSDPQGQIIDFPIQSNFREGLTLTEYLISTYGARKGIVDTALRTATAGYLTRRLVDVAQHVIVSQFDCGTNRGIFLFDMKEANKTIYSFPNRLIGRVLANDILTNKFVEVSSEVSTNEKKQLLFPRNIEIDSKCADVLAKITKKAFVRSPLTCETQKFVCQLCYGWSLSSGKLVSIGEAVGVIAAQSIGEPGTQLTMRTFHTGGVFAGGITDQILAPFQGQIEFFHSIPGTCIRTSLSSIAFLTKAPGSFFVKKKKEEKFPMRFTSSETDEHFSNIQKLWKLQNKNTNFSEIYKIPSYAILFVRNGEFVEKKQLLAQFSTLLQKQVQYGTAEQTFYSTLAGEFILGGLAKFVLPTSLKSRNETNFLYLKKKEETQRYSSSEFFEQKKKTKFFPTFSFSKEIENETDFLYSEEKQNEKNNENQEQKIELIIEKKPDSVDLSEMEQKYDLLWKSKNWTNIWILSGHIFSNSIEIQTYLTKGDCIKTTSVVNRILWKKQNKFQIFSISRPVPFVKKKFGHINKNKRKIFYLNASEKFQNSGSFFSSFRYSFDSLPFLPMEQIKKAFSFQKKEKKSFSNSRARFQQAEKKLQKNILNLKAKNGNQQFQYKQSIEINHSLNFFKRTGTPFLKQFIFSDKTFHRRKNFSKKESFLRFSTRPTGNIFSINLQNFFSFLHKSTKTKFKNQNKQLFYKFSTLNKNSFYLNCYLYSKLQNKTKKTFRSKQIFQFAQKNYLSFTAPYFVSFKQKQTNLFQNLKFDQKRNQFSFCKLKKNFGYKFFSKNSQFVLYKYSKLVKYKQFMPVFFSNKKKVLLKTKHFISNFIFSKQTILHSAEQNYSTLFFKKPLFQFQFDKLRYNNVGYNSIFSIHSKKSISCFGQKNSFSLFFSLNQFFSESFKTLNPGKNEIHFGNASFVGKDVPTFLGYCLPNDSQTLTNGIFMIKSFENVSKKNSQKKFLCSEQNYLQTFSFHFFDSKIQKKTEFQAFPNGTKYFQNLTIEKRKNLFFQTTSNIPSVIFPSNFHTFKKQKEIKKKRGNFKKKVLFIKITTFDFFKFLNLKTNYLSEQTKSSKTISSTLIQFSNQLHFVFPISKNKNLLKNIETKRKLSLDSFISFQKQKFEKANNIHFQSFSYLYNFQNTKNIFEKRSERSYFEFSDSLQIKQSSNKFGQNQFQTGDFSRKFSLFLKRRFLFKNQKSFQSCDFYSDEIFWLPQENYLISTSFFENKTKKNQLKTSNACSKIYKQNQPLFFVTNKQGKKKPIFSKLQGILNWSSFSIQKTSFPFMKRKTNLNKFDFFQQKFSFFSEDSMQKKSVFTSVNFLKKPSSFQNHNSQKQNFQRKKPRRKKTEPKNLKNIVSKSFRFSQYKIKKQKLILLKAKKNQKFKPGLILFNHRTRQNQFSINFFKMNSRSIGFQKQKNFNQNKKTNLQKNLKKNFSFGLFKKQDSKNLSHLQKLFFQKFEKCSFSKKKSSHFKFGFARKLSHDCLSCLPFEKKKIPNKFKVDLPKSKRSLVQSKNLTSQKINMKIQSGWIYIVSNPMSLFKSHQHMSNIGQFWKSSVGFEQHKIFVEIVVLNLSSIYRKIQVIDECFSINKFVKNKNCRFSNEGANFAQQQFFVAFENRKQRIQGFSNEKMMQKSKKLVVFFRPFHYKIVENSMNYKKIFEDQNRKKGKPNNTSLEMTVKKNWQKRKTFSKQFDFEISLSSTDIYKKYHSSVWNIQKVFKKFLLNSIDFDFEISSEFSKQIRKIGQKDFHSSKAKILFFSKLKRTQNNYESRLQRKESFQKFSKFKLISQRIRLNKFDSLLNRNIFERKSIKNVFFSSKKLNEKKLKRATKEKKKKQKNSVHFFFSFYPIQFLPMKISSNIVCKNFNSFLPFSNILNSQKILALFINSLTNKLQFCLCDKKAAFFNQRVSVSNSSLKFSPSSLYFLNKDGLQFHSSLDSEIFQPRSFGILKTERKLNNFQNSNFLFSLHKQQAFKSLFFKNNDQKQTTKSNFRRKENKRNNKKQILFENTSFQNNPNYYANTKFLSPHQGEILSIGTNEKNWWKKASEISTIQKLDNLFTILTKTDLFVVQFPTTNKQFETMNFVELKDLKPIDIEKKKNYLVLNEKKQLKFCLQKKQNHLLSLYEFVFKTQKNSIFSTNFGFDESEIEKNDFLKNSKSNEKTIFLTKYENKLYKFENLNVNYAPCSKKPMLGTFFVYGDCIFQNAIRKPGQVVHLSRKAMTLRKGQPFLVSPKGILHFSTIPYIQKNVPLLTLPYQTVQSGDIVQGIPKVEQYFEARTTVQGRFFVSSLPIILKGIFERYKATLPLEQATRQSFLKIQQIVVDGVQRVYRSQGVSITDKHLEVVVRQMTTKVQILNGAQTGFFPGELVNLDFVEKVNKFLMVKIRYEPVILGITRASLEVDSFLSASSFQQTTKILSLSAISKKKDFLKGLKENLLVGNLIPSGTGYFRVAKTVQKF